MKTCDVLFYAQRVKNVDEAVIHELALIAGKATGVLSRVSKQLPKTEFVNQRSLVRRLLLN